MQPQNKGECFRMSPQFCSLTFVTKSSVCASAGVIPHFSQHSGELHKCVSRPGGAAWLPPHPAHRCPDFPVLDSSEVFHRFVHISLKTHSYFSQNILIFLSKHFHISLTAAPPAILPNSLPRLSSSSVHHFVRGTRFYPNPTLPTSNQFPIQFNYKNAQFLLSVLVCQEKSWSLLLLLYFSNMVNWICPKLLTVFLPSSFLYFSTDVLEVQTEYLPVSVSLLSLHPSQFPFSVSHFDNFYLFNKNIIMHCIFLHIVYFYEINF